MKTFFLQTSNLSFNKFEKFSKIWVIKIASRNGSFSFMLQFFRLENLELLNSKCKKTSLFSK